MGNPLLVMEDILMAYCGPTDAPFACLAELIESVKADGPKGLATPASISHIGAIVSYVGNSLRPKVFGTPDEHRLATAQFERFQAELVLAVDELTKDCPDCTLDRDPKAMRGITDFVISQIFQQLLAWVIQQAQDPETWDRVLTWLRDLINKNERLRTLVEQCPPLNALLNAGE